MGVNCVVKVESGALGRDFLLFSLYIGSWASAAIGAPLQIYWESSVRQGSQSEDREREWLAGFTVNVDCRECQSRQWTLTKHLASDWAWTTTAYVSSVGCKLGQIPRPPNMIKHYNDDLREPVINAQREDAKQRAVRTFVRARPQESHGNGKWTY